ncbi:VacJ family lipoprotein [uncultured Sphingomonas sp.]|uniref:MlaA family lipoprotein n=1 Tax=uncultured Sphingomonas sp. TaxID=158754 RepID=UPI0035C9E000
MIALLVAIAAPQAAATPPASPATKTARAAGDPFERFNRRMFRGHQGFDRHVLRPAALAYKHGVPGFLRSALRNILSTLGEPVVFLNYLLQGKPGKAAETLGRFTVNVGLGLGGAIDIARLPGVRLPHRPNGFGDTLGFYGVKPGPYLFLPFVGPTDLRDLFGGQADGVLVLPLVAGVPFNRAAFSVPRAVIDGLDRRAEADADLKALLDDAVDPYASLRSVYLQDRAGEIAQLKGHAAAATPAPELDGPLTAPADARKPAEHPAPELQDPLADPAGSSSPAATAAPELGDPLADPAAPPPGQRAAGGPPAPTK